MDWAKNLPWPAIRQVAQSHNLDPHLVAAVVQQESSGRQWLMRFEPNWRYFLQPDDFASHLGISHETERALQAMSFGFMQVMGSVARELGFKGQLPELLEADKALEYGCRHLRRLYERYGTETEAIAAYNAGNAIKEPSGMFRNQRYVDSASQYLAELRKMVD